MPPTPKPGQAAPVAASRASSWALIVEVMIRRWQSGVAGAAASCTEIVAAGLGAGLAAGLTAGLVTTAPGLAATATGVAGAPTTATWG